MTLEMDSSDEYLPENVADYHYIDDEVLPVAGVCSICDNGGVLLCCEGICMRAFHPTTTAAGEARDAFSDPRSQCVSLGLSDEQVEAMFSFRCENCRQRRHQCFACGNLGSSDRAAGAEVFQCVHASCGYFYHPSCVAKKLNPNSEAAATELEGRILGGASFTCPHHICAACNQPENRADPDLQMAVCRRCPKAYHERCLPRNIPGADYEGVLPQRAWKYLLEDRTLMYCLEHNIVDYLCTPARNHIQFPQPQAE